MNDSPNSPSDFFEAWTLAESAENDTLRVKKLYIDINDGNVHDGILFSQIMYWHSLDKHGKPRMKIQKDGALWLAKEYTDWWDECRINARMARVCIQRMIDRGLIFKTVYRFNGLTTVHIRINPAGFKKRVEAVLAKMRNDTTCQTGTTPDVNLGTTPHVDPLTETTKGIQQILETTSVSAAPVPSVVANKTNGKPIEPAPKPPKAPKPKAERKRDPVFDAVGEHIYKAPPGSVLATELGGWIGKTTAGLKKLLPTITPQNVIDFMVWDEWPATATNKILLHFATWLKESVSAPVPVAPPRELTDWEKAEQEAIVTLMNVRAR